MSGDPPPQALQDKSGRRLQAGPDRVGVLDGEFRLVRERRERSDPIIRLYEIYERCGVPLGVVCVLLGLVFGLIGLLVSGGAFTHR